MSHPHRWKFCRIGGLDQARLESGNDLLELRSLDPKLWTVLSCPTKGLEFDSKTLTYLDADKDGRIRIQDVLAAVQWTTERIKNADDMVRSSVSLPLSAINEATETGKTLLASARHILRNIGKADADSITPDDTGDTARIFANTKFNGDGVITPDAMDDGALRQVITEVMTLFGHEIDRSGKKGINQAKLDNYFSSLRDYADWRAAERRFLKGGADALPFGDSTPAAFSAYHKVKAKVADYFMRCRLAAFDPQAGASLNPPNSAYLQIALNDLSVSGDMDKFPLQQIAPSRPLYLNEGLNPAWRRPIETFAQTVVQLLFGSDSTGIDESQWEKIISVFSGYEQWLAGKKGAAAETLGLDRVTEILASDNKEKISDFIRQDLALAKESSDIDAVDQLVRYYLHLPDFLKNFVNLDDFYNPNRRPIFQYGVLFFDQRSFDLCIRVDDPNAHATIAATSKLFIAYVACVRSTGEKMTIAASITRGETEYIAPGRNGVFYDAKGRDWDATVIKVVDNAVDLQQAFWSPYRKISKLVEAQIQKFAASKDKALQEKAAASAEDAAKTAENSKTPIKKDAFDIAKFAGVFAAIGLAIGAIGGALSLMLSAFFNLTWWQMPLALVGALIAFSGPSLILAWFNLRSRTLNPLLEGNGWAINGRVRINIPLGNSLTHLRALPPNAIHSVKDPFADKDARRKTIIYTTFFVVVILALIWQFAVKPRYLDVPAKKPPAETQAPAAPASPEPAK